MTQANKNKQVIIKQATIDGPGVRKVEVRQLYCKNSHPYHHVFIYHYGDRDGRLLRVAKQSHETSFSAEEAYYEAAKYFKDRFRKQAGFVDSLELLIILGLASVAALSVAAVLTGGVL